MAEINPPSWLQARTDHKAQQYRRMLGSLMYDRGGVVQNLDLQVTQNGTPNMSVNVATGRVFVPGTLGTYQGLYHCDNQGVVNKSISAAHATNPRYDRVYAVVQDAEYAGATNAWSIEVATGTPAASPTEPTLPSNSFELARITVGAAVTSITNANILDRRVSAGKGRASALGGVTTTLSGALPTANLTEGMVAVETDTNYAKIYNGTAWVGVGAYAAPADQFYTDDLSGGSAGSMTAFATRNSVLTAPYPLTMVVTSNLEAVLTSTVSRLYVEVWDEAGANITQGGKTFPGTRISDPPAINVHFDMVVVGKKDYSAGATCGYRLAYKRDAGAAWAAAVTRVQFLPKAS